MKKYYVYQHIREDKNEIFYIGIGTKSKQDIRCNTYSRAYSKHIDNNIWLKIVAKTNWKFEILFESDNRKEVEQMEIKLIAKYGRKCDNTGCLANLTLGGEKNLGYKHSKEALEKISKKAKRKRGPSTVKYTPELRKKLSEIQKEIANRPEKIEYRKRLAKGNSYHLGHKHSEETKAKMAKAALKRGVNAKTIKCKLIDKTNKLTWEADSIASLSKIVPLSLSTISRLSRGVRVSSKTNEQFEFIKIEE